MMVRSCLPHLVVWETLISISRQHEPITWQQLYGDMWRLTTGFTKIKTMINHYNGIPIRNLTVVFISAPWCSQKAEQEPQQWKHDHERRGHWTMWPPSGLSARSLPKHSANMFSTENQAVTLGFMFGVFYYYFLIFLVLSLYPRGKLLCGYLS